MSKKLHPYSGKPKRKRHENWASDRPQLLHMFRHPHDNLSVRQIIEKYAYWIDDPHLSDPALIAVATADTIGDWQPVLDFIGSKHRWTDFGRAVVVDFFNRQKASKRGRKPTPMYDRTNNEMLVDLAKISVSDLVAEGVSRKEAIERAASDLEIPIRIVRNACEGRHASIRRAAERLTKRGFRIPPRFAEN